MEFGDVVRQRRMVRRFDGRPVPRDVVQRVLEPARRGPSAGWSQGTEFVVLEGAEQTAPFWDAPVVVLPLADKQAYLDRYSLPDKMGRGMDREEGWPVPYWEVDTAFATMLLLLAAVDAGLGALFFGLFDGKEEAVAALGVPGSYRAIGGVALGYPAPGERSQPSWKGGRRSFEEVVHFGGFRGEGTGATR